MKIINKSPWLAFALALAPPAQAGVVELGAPALGANIGSGELLSQIDFVSQSTTVTDEGDGTFSYNGLADLGTVSLDWNLHANADPFIAGSLSFTNNTASTQTVNVVLTLPIPTLSGLVKETGSVSLKLRDTSGDGNADLVFNQWHGLINPIPGPPILDMGLLLGDAFNCAGGPGCEVTLLPALTGTQMHSEADHNGDAIDSLGIHLNFDLSAGDNVVINSRWEVQPVPVPAAAWLFGSGLLAMVGVARRRNG